jgi:mannose-6-phosphate isomerase-like protein (cupin superfamily)
LKIEDYIGSGILEEFVLGQLDQEACESVLALAEQHPEIKQEIEAIEASLEILARAYAVEPPAELEQQIFNAIQQAEVPPPLTPDSTISDYAYWLKTVPNPTDYENMHTELIAHSEEGTMVIAWIKHGEPVHLHTEYTEIFLIVEGSCNATIDGVTSDFSVGDYVEFTLDKYHSYTITSDIPMKVVGCMVPRAA